MSSCTSNTPNIDPPIKVDLAKIDALFETGDSISPTSIIHGNIHFAIDLFQEIQSPKKNLIYSPYSVSTAFGMLYAGSQKETADQIQHVLHFPGANTKLFHKAFTEVNDLIFSASQDAITLHSANKMWLKEGFTANDGFSEMTKAFYRSDLGYYKDAKNGSDKINKWVSEQTKGKIQDLLKPADLEPSSLVLANAVYFYGNWATQFEPQNTYLDTFWNNERPIPTDFMNAEIKLKTGTFETVDVFVLDYVGRTTSMMLVLPNEDIPLEKVVAQLSVDSYLDWCKKLRFEKIRLRLPKWKLSPPTIPLSEALIAKGLNIPFNQGATLPDFNNIAPNLYVSRILHKAMIEVNEAGAEAAATTSIVMEKRAIQAAFPVDINRPFLYFIKDNATESILFMGQVVDPSIQD
ncbi:MAG: Proteinase inhibitor I4, serpin [uncultured Aureispira sp.]|uniref:Proteinase inhibitor I4, serpin n=1 Tax=uncultured Aureispira sp. TaxID=1331704 RepID=A0A6S6RUJ3_9BACT|nr:MAG: Proteinase inhibitor I4, serpin [uncultured Aureispira sp.]